MEVKRICIGSDHAGFTLKNQLIKYIENDLKLQIVDCGVYTAERCDYPDYSVKVCERVLENASENLGIVVCGSGIGISIGCNKMKGIRCGLCHDYYTAKYSKEILNCNVISMGERVIGLDIAKQIVDVFVEQQYQSTPLNQVFLKHLEQIDISNSLQM